VRVIQAASAGGASSSLHHIASAAALTGELLKMRSLPAIKAVFDALGVSMSDPCLKAAGYDLPSLKAAGFDAAAFRAAGFSWSDLKAAGFTSSDCKSLGCDLASAQSAGYDVLSLIAGFGYDAVASSGCDVSCILVLPLPPPPPQSAQHGAALTTAAQAPGPNPSTSHPVTRVPQRDGGNLYMTLHMHRVDDHKKVRDGRQPLDVPAGWQIANPIADDIRVCGAHPWQSHCLVLDNGGAYGTASSSFRAGDRSFCCSVEKITKIYKISISAKTENQGKYGTSPAATLHRTRRG
jgi:hypothetical protein